MRYNEIIESLDSDDELFGPSGKKSFMVCGPDHENLKNFPTMEQARKYALAQIPSYLEDGYGQWAEPDFIYIYRDYANDPDNSQLIDQIPIEPPDLDESDDEDELELFGEPAKPNTPEKAIAKFRMHFPANKRVSWSRMNFRVIDEMFGFSNDNRFRAGESYSRHSYWSTQAYTNRETGLALLIYEDSGQGTWAYIGAHDRAALADMMQQLVAAGQLEDPEAAKQRRLAKQQARAATIEKKGIRVGTKIDIGHGITAEVIELKPTTGKVRMRDITGNHVGAEREYSVYGISKKNIVGESDEADDELFGTISFNAEQAGKLIATTGATSGEIIDPEGVQYALEHAANRVLNSPSVRRKAAEQLKQWMAMDDDDQWDLINDISDVVYDINGSGWESDDTIYNETVEEPDDDLFGRHWYENINPRSIELDGINSNDYPDFVDAYISYAETMDGKVLDDAQLEKLNDMYADSGRLHELVYDTFYESDESDDDLFGTTKKWYVYIWGNWYTGRYSDYQPRKYVVPGVTAADAVRWVKQNEIRIIQYFEKVKTFNGKRLLPRPAARNLFLDQTRVEGQAPDDVPLSRFAQGRGNAL